jgi:diguanylate cyclase (GGDEF)-like protein
MRGFSLRRLPITQRLAVINALLAVAVIVVCVAALETLDEQATPTYVLSRVSQARRFHQDADMLHDTVRADVYGALLLGADVANPAVQRSFTELHLSMHQLREDLDRLGEVELPTEIIERNKALQKLTEEYFLAAEAAVHSGQHSLAERSAALSKFDAAFEAVRKTMAEQTADLSNRVQIAENDAASAKYAAKVTIIITAILANIAGLLLIRIIANSISRSLKRVMDNASAVAGGELSVRNNNTDVDEIGQLARLIDSMSDKLQSMIDDMRIEAERGVFDNQLTEALEMMDTEAATHEVIARAMCVVSPNHAMELLLADSSSVHLERAIAHPLKGAPGCTVESPFNCPAVRRGLPTTFADSEALNACSHLRGRACGAVTAVCVPVSFMGRSLGVLHAVSEVSEPFSQDSVSKLTALGLQAGARLGTVRAFERTQVQATTDSLTGLANRRALEHEARALISTQKPFALIMADLDHFKRMNDKLGHQAGDSALKTFAAAVRAIARDSDVLARWGGEEFVFLLPLASATQAEDWVSRLRNGLAESLAASGASPFTSSFGVVDSTMANSLEDLIRIADLALYVSKDQGRDRSTIGSAAFITEGAPRHATEHGATIDLRLLARNNA